mmetsp:Transcript_11007/g.22459  ORF Transcript_11007/g.22459 Transcript_11007/m.22459 type:complete len:450 (-) Transcript_11007:625-1974(-)
MADAAAVLLTQTYRRNAAVLLQSLSSGSSNKVASAPAATERRERAVVGTKNQVSGRDGASCVEQSSSAGGVSDSASALSSGGGTATCKRRNGGDNSFKGSVDVGRIGRTLALRSCRVAPPLILGPTTSAKKNAVINGGDKDFVDTGQLREDYLCTTCGQLYYTDDSLDSTLIGELESASTTALAATVRLRPLRRGRTRRRRSSRKVARNITHNESIRKSKGGGRQWEDAVAVVQSHDQQRRLQNELLGGIRDGTKHHCVVYTCGYRYCGGRRKFAGVDVQRWARRKELGRKNKRKDEKVVKNGGKLRRKGSDKRMNVKTSLSSSAIVAATTTTAKGADTNADLDFISLPSLPPAKEDSIAIPSTATVRPERVAPRDGRKSSGNSSNFTFRDKAAESKKEAAAHAAPAKPRRLDQPSSRKRKKGGSAAAGGKRKGDKKSKLMDFLSSLND